MVAEALGSNLTTLLGSISSITANAGRSLQALGKHHCPVSTGKFPDPLSAFRINDNPTSIDHSPPPYSLVKTRHRFECAPRTSWEIVGFPEPTQAHRNLTLPNAFSRRAAV